MEHFDGVVKRTTKANMRLRCVDLHILASGRQENTAEQCEINKSFHIVQNGKKKQETNWPPWTY